MATKSFPKINLGADTPGWILLQYSPSQQFFHYTSQLDIHIDAYHLVHGKKVDWVTLGVFKDIKEASPTLEAFMHLLPCDKMKRLCGWID